MSHPSLGLPPPDPKTGHPGAAAAVRSARERLAGRALEDVVAADPTLRERYDEIALRRLLRDIGTFLDQLAAALEIGEEGAFISWCEATVPMYRKRGVPVDDLVSVASAVRRLVRASVEPAAAPAVDRAVDGATAAYRRHRRLAGDARKRNPVAAFLYKGA